MDIIDKAKKPKEKMRVQWSNGKFKSIALCKSIVLGRKGTRVYLRIGQAETKRLSCSSYTHSFPSQSHPSSIIIAIPSQQPSHMFTITTKTDGKKEHHLFIWICPVGMHTHHQSS